MLRRWPGSIPDLDLMIYAEDIPPVSHTTSAPVPSLYMLSAILVSCLLAVGIRPPARSCRKC